MSDGAGSIRALATVTLDARALDELGPETIDRLADLVEARLAERRAAGEELLLTPSAAAEIAGVHPETMRRAIRSGAVEVAGYVGARARLRRAAVDAWVAGGRRFDPVVRAARVVAHRGRGSHPRVLRDALDAEGGGGMSVQRVVLADGTVSWRVRWRDGGRGSRMNSRSFARKAHAVAFDDELRRRRRLGDMATVVGSQDTLDGYVAETWAKTHAVTLARSTARTYAGLYDLHVSPYLGQLKLAELTPEVIARWQAQRIASGAGRSSIHKTLTLLGGILQRATESGRIGRNPVRLVRKVKRPKKKEVRPLAPASVEALRAACGARDATLIAVLAYSGLRPQEALALRWDDIRERTILVERAVSLGEESDTKTTAHRTVRLLAPLREDLLAWKLRSGRPRETTAVFPGPEGRSWSKTSYDNWRGRNFDRAIERAGIDGATPYALRHSFASLLLHEGRSVIYVARQLGHDARLTLSTYGHVIDELDGAPQMPAEDAIRAARGTRCALGVPSAREPERDAGGS